MPSKPIKVAALRERADRDCRAQIDAVIAEFGGEADASAALTRMAEEILYWRSRMQLLSDVVAKVRTEEPFAIIGAGSYWQPGQRSQWWWR
jgi:hypothetical protein